MKVKAGKIVKVKDIGQLAKVIETAGRNAVLDFNFPEGVCRVSVPTRIIDCIIKGATA